MKGLVLPAQRPWCPAVVPKTAISGVALLAIAAGAPAPADPSPPASAVRQVAEFPDDEVPIDTWMKRYGWKVQRGDAARFRVGEARLAMVSDDDTVAIGTQQGFPVRPQEWPIVRFDVQVTALPEGAGLSQTGTDDAAFRLFVAFDRDRGIVSPPHTIAYTWSNDLAPGSVVQSEHFENVRYLVIGRGLTRPGEWVAVERELAADYRKVFPEAEGGVPALSGVLLKCDSNNTGTKAASAVRSIEFAGASR
jgi:hypothetical protein